MMKSTTMKSTPGKINEGFWIFDGSLLSREIAREFLSPAEEVTRSVKPCRLGCHLVKTKILTEVYSSYLKKIWSLISKIDLWCPFNYLKSDPTGLIELLLHEFYSRGWFNITFTPELLSVYLKFTRVTMNLIKFQKSKIFLAFSCVYI